ncbi:MAG: CPBP family intramembrane metalloprotease [Bacteroidales bacterium]|nr:CPBP family intramembrane metalloprotease [Bacteroidales bacterium]
MKKYFLEMGFWGRLFVFLALTVFLMLGSIIIGDIVAFFVFGQDAMLAMEAPVVQLLQTFMAIGLFLLPPIFMVMLCCEGSLWDNLMVSKRPNWRTMALCIAIMIVSAPLVSWLEEVNLRMKLPDSMASIETWMREREDAASGILNKLTKSADPICFVINLLVLAVLPGLSEEMFFRVGLQTRLFGDKTRIQGYWAAIATAVLFSALHMQFFGFLPRMVLGAILGIMVLYSGNVWYSIAAHFFNNMIAVTIAYMEACGVEMQSPKWIETWWAALLSASATVAMIMLLYKVEKKSKKTLNFR